jgi:hypothetical protein
MTSNTTVRRSSWYERCGVAAAIIKTPSNFGEGFFRVAGVRGAWLRHHPALTSRNVAGSIPDEVLPATPRT